MENKWCISKAAVRWGSKPGGEKGQGMRAKGEWGRGSKTLEAKAQGMSWGQGGDTVNKRRDRAKNAFWEAHAVIL